MALKLNSLIFHQWFVFVVSERFYNRRIVKIDGEQGCQRRATSTDMTLHIVHLEDEKDLLEGMKFVLEELEPDAYVIQFAKADSILDYIDAHADEISLFILDIRVPGPLNGFDVARHIRKIGCTAAIIVTSAYEPPSPQLIQELDIHYFRKPWDLPETVLKMLAYVKN